MKNVTTIGIDIAKNVFQLHGVDEQGKEVFKKRVSRAKLLEVMREMPRCLVGMEACSGSHYWARQLRLLGHDVRVMSPQHVKPYIGASKNDYKDAAGICEAVSRPKMLYVPVKSVEQQDIQSIHRVRSRLITARTALANQIRGLLGEYGIVLGRGLNQVRRSVLKHVAEPANELTASSRELLEDLYDELVMLDGRVKRYDEKLETLYKSHAGCQKLAAVEGIGPITATAVIAAVGDARVFKNGRQLAAWLGLTPKQHSSGEKQRLLGISKRGDSYVRYLLIHGARSVIRHSGKKQDKKSLWIIDKVQRRGKNKAAVALANKTARTLWALLTQETVYQKAQA